MIKPLRIVFMGTPEFAVASLQALHCSVHVVVAVVTAPDKPASRGLKLRTSAVKDYALKNNLPILQPEKLKSPDFTAQLKDFAPDIQVVVAFRMLPEDVWALPALGTINLHASLLPNYRGAAPINRAIMNGEKMTGVTTFLLNREIDTGDILLQEAVEIQPDDDAGSLHDKLMAKGARLLVKTVDALSAGILKPTKQIAGAQSDIKTAPKLFRNDCRIDWNMNTERVNNFVRGLSPYPGAWTTLADKSDENTQFILKIYKGKPSTIANLPSGALMAEGDVLFIGCSGGSLQILELQQEGKKRMSAAEFLRGFRNNIINKICLI